MSEEKEWFFDWRPPDKLLARANTIRRNLGGESFFNKPGLSWLREAWTIGRFGGLVGASSCRLARSDPPDGEIKISEIHYPVEVVEALEPGRKRGQEYRGERPEFEHIDQATWGRHERDAPEWCATSARHKLEASTKYPAGTLVLIHLSAALFFPFDPAESERAHADLHKRFFSALPEPTGNVVAFCILAGGSAYYLPRLFAKKLYLSESGI